MLIYALLHLTGYEKPTMEDIRNFRQLNSPCAGHPENFMLPGVEATTGPLGQGFAMAVGMAIAERHLSAVFGDDLVDHRTWRSEEHTSELQSLMRISYAVFCLKNKNTLQTK